MLLFTIGQLCTLCAFIQELSVTEENRNIKWSLHNNGRSKKSPSLSNSLNGSIIHHLTFGQDRGGFRVQVKC